MCVRVCVCVCVQIALIFFSVWSGLGFGIDSGRLVLGIYTVRVGCIVKGTVVKMSKSDLPA